MSRSDGREGCSATRERLEAYLDGALEEAEVERLGAHLGRCPACARELELAAAIRHELRALPELDAPAGVVESVLATARASGGRPRGWWNRLWRAPAVRFPSPARWA